MACQFRCGSLDTMTASPPTRHRAPSAWRRLATWTSSRTAIAAIVLTAVGVATVAGVAMHYGDRVSGELGSLVKPTRMPAARSWPTPAPVLPEITAPSYAYGTEGVTSPLSAPPPSERTVTAPPRTVTLRAVTSQTIFRTIVATETATATTTETATATVVETKTVTALPVPPDEEETQP
jgi:hypothetical protein